MCHCAISLLTATNFKHLGMDRILNNNNNVHISWGIVFRRFCLFGVLFVCFNENWWLETRSEATWKGKGPSVPANRDQPAAQTGPSTAWVFSRADTRSSRLTSPRRVAAPPSTALTSPCRNFQLPELEPAGSSRGRRQAEGRAKPRPAAGSPVPPEAGRLPRYGPGTARRAGSGRSRRIAHLNYSP